MLQINLSRYSIQGELAEGQLYIEGCKICDTLEHATSCLPTGEYLITMAHCKHFKRKMPLIGPIDLGKRGLRDCNHCSGLSLEEECLERPDDSTETDETAGTDEAGTQKRRSFLNNSCLPRFCPMIRPGNGVHHMQDGRLLVGERLVAGCIQHPKAYFDQLVNRIKEQSRMQQPVMLNIRNLTEAEAAAHRSQSTRV